MNEIGILLADIRLFDFVDILIVTLIIYALLKLFKDSRSIRIIYGISLIFLLYFIASFANLITIKWMLLNLLPIALIVMVILFQPELRRALETLGRGTLFKQGKIRNSVFATQLGEIKKAASALSKNRHGALIVMERETGLAEFVETGTRVDAVITSELLQTIFFPNTFLHDGAVIVKDGKIIAAGCLLPLTDNIDLDKSLGTRHRAAVGISEITDSTVIVVSEETGIISLVHNGSIKRDLELGKLTKMVSRLWSVR